MSLFNPGCELDEAWLGGVHVNGPAVTRYAARLSAREGVLRGDWRAAWLLRALTCIDLTTLSGDDTAANVDRLCAKAAAPLPVDVAQACGLSSPITTAAVCVYPARVKDAASSIARLRASDAVSIASVVTGFPSGQYPLETRLAEVQKAVADGATEVDMVLDRSLVLGHRWQEVYGEVRQVLRACGDAHLKVILAAGELATYEDIYRAALVSMMAGAHFVKTSTGKETVNATIPIGIVMCRAIKDYYLRTGYKVGFKPAGGIRTGQDALRFLLLVREEIGPEWLTSKLFRIGASGLLSDIEKQIYQHVTGRFPNIQDFVPA